MDEMNPYKVVSSATEPNISIKYDFNRKVHISAPWEFAKIILKAVKKYVSSQGDVLREPESDLGPIKTFMKSGTDFQTVVLNVQQFEEAVAANSSLKALLDKPIQIAKNNPDYVAYTKALHSVHSIILSHFIENSEHQTIDGPGVLFVKGEARMTVEQTKVHIDAASIKPLTMLKQEMGEDAKDINISFYKNEETGICEPTGIKFESSSAKRKLEHILGDYIYYELLKTPEIMQPLVLQRKVFDGLSKKAQKEAPGSSDVAPSSQIGGSQAMPNANQLDEPNKGKSTPD